MCLPLTGTPMFNDPPPCLERSALNTAVKTVQCALRWPVFVESTFFSYPKPPDIHDAQLPWVTAQDRSDRLMRYVRTCVPLDKKGNYVYEDQLDEWTRLLVATMWRAIERMDKNSVRFITLHFFKIESKEGQPCESYMGAVASQYPLTTSQLNHVRNG